MYVQWNEQSKHVETTVRALCCATSEFALTFRIFTRLSETSNSLDFRRVSKGPYFTEEGKNRRLRNWLLAVKTRFSGHCGGDIWPKPDGSEVVTVGYGRAIRARQPAKREANFLQRRSSLPDFSTNWGESTDARADNSFAWNTDELRDFKQIESYTSTGQKDSTLCYFLTSCVATITCKKSRISSCWWKEVQFRRIWWPSVTAGFETVITCSFSILFLFFFLCRLIILIIFKSKMIKKLIILV